MYIPSQDTSYRDEDWKCWAYKTIAEQGREIDCLKADKRLIAERLRYIVRSVPVEQSNAELTAIADAIEQGRWIGE